MDGRKMLAMVCGVLVATASVNVRSQTGASSANITVRANGGTVTLAGTVPEAAQVAQGVAGVTSVKNALTIRPVGE